MNQKSIRILLAAFGVCVGLAPQRVLAAADTPAMPSLALEFVQRALPDGLPETPGDGRSLFTQVLAGPAFVRAPAGPFDVHVFVGEGLPTEREALQVLSEVQLTLQPAARLITERWPQGGEGLISAARLPLVIVDPGEGGTSYRQLLALLDHCEVLGYSGWAPAGAVDTPENRAAEVARTWEVQIFDLSHPRIAGWRDEWLGHGVGYYALTLVANRALRQGAWGQVPSWLMHGLIDELDIAAYGRAWNGPGDGSERSPDWYVMEDAAQVPAGAPAPSMAATFTGSGEPWLNHESSQTRHWEDLVGELRTQARAGVALGAAGESLQPRDQAAARCLLALIDEIAPDPDGTLTALLDRPARVGPDGMPDSDPLPMILAQALGGVPDVERLESLTTRALLEELGRADLIEKIEALGALGVLSLSDHRDQSRWLFKQPRFERDERVLVFHAILEVEHAQQSAEWKVLSARLERGLEAALRASPTYPVERSDVARVAEAFRRGLASDPAPAPPSELAAQSEAAAQGERAPRSEPAPRKTRRGSLR